MSKNLTGEHPMILLKNLAVEIGLNEAIMLQQLQYWEGKATVKHAGRMWVFKTVKEWRKQDFPFWSIGTINNVIKSLRDKNLILVEQLSKHAYVRKNYYCVNYQQVDKINEIIAAKLLELDCTNISHSSSQELDSRLSNIDNSDCTNISDSKCTNISHSLRDEINEEINIKEKPKAVKKNKHEMPSDFKVTDIQQQKCYEYGINSKELVIEFDNFHSSKGNKYVDWSKAFSTWIGNHIKFGKLSPINQNQRNRHDNQQPKQSKYDSHKQSIQQQLQQQFESEDAQEADYNSSCRDVYAVDGEIWQSDESRGLGYRND